MSRPQIIGFCGVARSGKDTCARYLRDQYSYHHASFAGGIKAMVEALLRYRGLSEDEIIYRMLHDDLKETSTHYLGQATPRTVMQTLGTEWGRKYIHPHLWVATELDHVRAIAGEVLIVFSDVRFENEIEAIKYHNGAVVYIHRPGAGLLGDASAHESERVGSLASQCTFEIVNDSTIDDLYKALDQILDRFN